MNDQELALDVNEELVWDPKVDAEAVAVSADEGTVTLRGTVGSFRQKREARKAAERVAGVVYVDNELDVRLLDEERRDDAELRGDVLQALMLDAFVPTTIDATVKDGFVTLSGSADSQYQRDEAEFLAGNVIGVAGVQDDVYLTEPTADPADVQHSIKKALERAAKIEADDITVGTYDGRVTLTGTVGSWYEHDTAVAAAWAAPGVVTVDDNLTVSF
jgi:osmotically-inducible protein OsmY